MKLDAAALQDRQVNRLVKSMKTAYKNKVNELSDEVESLEEELEKAQEFDADIVPQEWVDKVNDLEIELELAKKRKEITIRSMNKYFPKEENNQ